MKSMASASSLKSGNPLRVFYFAINTSSNGTADPSTGEWDFPAGSSSWGKLTAGWQDYYNKLDAYMAEEEEGSESRLLEVHAILCDAMKMTRGQWQARLGNCLFTVNECNDSDELVLQTCKEINEGQD